MDKAREAKESYGRLFLRFLTFGLLAWGGPVAQIAMIRQELVEEEGWISRERFNRVLAVYQALPGPEAHELCVYFGMIRRGRVGAVLAGLGFMLPGFLLMLLLSWWYVEFGTGSPWFQGLFYGFQAAVAALIVRAVWRIGGHALGDGWLWGIALLGGAAHLLRVNFLLILVLGGLVYLWVKRGRADLQSSLQLAAPIWLAGEQPVWRYLQQAAQTPGLALLFYYGLRSGLLTFGGAYTAIPILQQDAVVTGAWMSETQFLDGLALSSILPAPFIIFSTFVGYMGGGLWGAVVLTAGIFLPAFLFTLVGHEFFERLVENKNVHAFLDGVTAGVVGIIGATAVGILQTALGDWVAVLIFVGALGLLFRWKAKAAVLGVMLAAGLAGILFGPG